MQLRGNGQGPGHVPLVEGTGQILAHDSSSANGRRVDRHWSFTKAHNAEGVIQMDKVLQALEQSGAEEVYLFPELIHPFEFPEDKLLEELDESYEYLRQYVCQPAAA